MKRSTRNSDTLEAFQNKFGHQWKQVLEASARKEPKLFSTGPKLGVWRIQAQDGGFVTQEGLYYEGKNQLVFRLLKNLIRTHP